MKPTSQMTRLRASAATAKRSRFKIKWSAICTAIIGAKTEPIRYKKPVMSSIGKRMAPATPMTVTTMAVFLPFSLGVRLSAEMPADQASRNVVVTVENTRITSAAMPSPALTMMTAMSYSPVKIAAPMPMTYIQQDTSP